ncbi:Hint domain-containing protein [Shewanella sp. D64]|uniref:Hint domain-containing protein n=1 Tax=unclassified Shewanella TaxID=196818 RepID=UPI0022BA1E70|nr:MULTISPECIES: Hint domain-containing protein [unclassified Shewanella]MEC4724257.1 Hint domain-containing protein [Shewanella sp. D64]MEC4738769.1 Hint domain-containing protein [Shewanella sp. E94]WBJ97791.1 Hint domain-containing protein [Shewanella sp. MTB7]
MTLPASGSISLTQINTESGRSDTAAASLGGSRNLVGVPSTGPIAISDFYGAYKNNAPTTSGATFNYSAGSTKTWTIQLSNYASDQDGNAMTYHYQAVSGIGFSVTAFNSSSGQISCRLIAQSEYEPGETHWFGSGQFSFYTVDVHGSTSPVSIMKFYINYSEFNNCFPSGTLITMADGRLVPIETIKLGDRLAAPYIEGMLDESLEHWEAFTSKHVFTEMRQADVVRIEPSAGFILDFNDGLLAATREHPWWVQRDDVWRWLKVREIQVGDKLYRPLDKAVIEIVSIASVENVSMNYSLDVEDIDTYLANGFIVHNKDIP